MTVGTGDLATALNQPADGLVGAALGVTVPDLNEQLLRALWDECAAVLWAFVVRLTDGDPMRAQDMMQETIPHW